jgi:hypothetical protein
VLGGQRLAVHPVGEDTIVEDLREGSRAGEDLLVDRITADRREPSVLLCPLLDALGPEDRSERRAGPDRRPDGPTVPLHATGLGVVLAAAITSTLHGMGDRHRRELLADRGHRQRGALLASGVLAFRAVLAVCTLRAVEAGQRDVPGLLVDVWNRVAVTDEVFGDRREPVRKCLSVSGTDDGIPVRLVTDLPSARFALEYRVDLLVALSALAVAHTIR